MDNEVEGHLAPLVRLGWRHRLTCLRHALLQVALAPLIEAFVAKLTISAQG